MEAEKIRELALKHALKNAVQYGGRALESAVVSKVLGESQELKKFARQIVEIVREVVAYVNALTLEEQHKLVREKFPELLEEVRQLKHREEKALPPLPNVSKYRVVRTRFAPNPDFYIHLGNARPALLSYEYAREYRGAFILRFEDTDPRIKKPLPEAYRAIREDLKWLGISWSEEYVQSMRMELYYGIARELISRGGAYVDLCKRDEFRKFKLERRACPHRSQSPSEALELFDRMLSNYYGEGEAVVRVKTDLTSEDPSLIDWVALRVIDTSKYPHPLTGDRYVVWPTYNFAAGVDDKLMEVTHILRGKEHALNTVKQLYVYRALGWEYPEVINLGRLKLEGVILSKSRIKEVLKSSGGAIEVDDPRFGTLRSLRRRGISPEVIREIIMEVGVKGTDATISWENIASLNRKRIDLSTPRVMAVFNPVRVVVRGVPKESSYRSLKLGYHPSNASLGFRVVNLGASDDVEVFISREDLDYLLKDGSIRLMEFCNIALEGRSRDHVEARYAGTDLEVARREGFKIVQWVPVSGYTVIELVKPENLKLRVLRGVVEESIMEFGVGRVLQLVRVGFIKLERLYKEKGRVRAIYIHD
ncbi:MAG: glutamate--tRNA ligase [Sulfolobales archaeon]|nr:glutamate--tRNA ligase [Sulfolobales archaeon]MDW8010555.1 glutamate--tRNA ligase [Sulfolobales archaeon]